MIKTSKTINYIIFFTLFVNSLAVYSQSESENITNLIEQKKLYNKKNKNSTVYKIQLYNGNEPEAYKIKQLFNAEFMDYKAEVVYDKPEWKTQVNTFKTRLDADRVAKIIKEKFAGAIVLEDKI